MRAFAILCLLICFSPAALACATCYGDPDDPQTQGMNMAILFMIGVVGTMLSLFAAFFVHLRMRAKLVAHGNLDSQNAGPFLRGERQ